MKTKQITPQLPLLNLESIDKLPTMSAMKSKVTVSKNHCLFSILILLAIWMMAMNAQGTVILFRPASGSPSFGNYANLPLGCGNRVVAENQDGFSYKLDYGPTPNIVAQY